MKPTWVRYQVLAAGCLLALLTYIQRLGFATALPKIKQDLGFTDTQTGDLSAAFLIAYGGFQVVGGWLGDRLGPRYLLTFLVLAWSLLTGAVALTVYLPALALTGLVAVSADLPAVVTMQFGFLVVLRFLFGMFQAGGFPAWARVLADWMPVQERGLAQGTVWTFSRLGGAVSPFIILWLLGLFATWTTPFWVIAGLGVLWFFALFWPWFRNRPEDMKQVNAAERNLIAAGRGAAPAAPALPWARMLRTRSVWGLCLMYGFVGFSGNFITSLLPVYLEDHCHLAPQDAAWAFALTLIGGMFACFVGGVLSDLMMTWTRSRKWGRRLNAAIGLIVAGLAFLTVPWIDGAWLLALWFGVAFFCNDLTMGPAWAACADIGERYAGTLSGAMNMIGAFAGAAGMRLAGMLLDQHQYELLFLIFACSYGAAALSWLAVDVTKPLNA